MGRVKQEMMEDEDNNNLVEFLEELIEREEITDVVLGIAKQVVAKGVNSMSGKQKSIIDNIVDKYKSRNECELCLGGNVGSLTDYIFIAENRICPTCTYDKEKSMRD